VERIVTCLKRETLYNPLDAFKAGMSATASEVQKW
jgi:hypothetical protein